MENLTDGDEVEFGSINNFIIFEFESIFIIIEFDLNTLQIVLIKYSISSNFKKNQS